jgi:hypothetical protein
MKLLSSFILMTNFRRMSVCCPFRYFVWGAHAPLLRSGWRLAHCTKEDAIGGLPMATHEAREAGILPANEVGA